MSAPEIVYRIRKTVFTKVQGLGLLTAAKVPPPTFNEEGGGFIGGAKQVQLSQYQKAADEIIKGRLSIFALNKYDFYSAFDWNRDPRTGTPAPLHYGKTLNYRDQEIVGDIKYLWEPNRHLHLVTLAQAYYLTNELRYLETLREHLTSWFEQCPYLRGPNWTSSLELAIRLINWSIVWQLVGGRDSQLFAGDDGKAFLHRWLKSIYQHVHFIKGHFSKYSSGNNHLIGELAGIVVAATTWPYWKEFVAWSHTARKQLQKEALLQNAGDGVNREQAVAYQQFVLDFLLFAGFAARASGEDFSANYWQRIEAMIEYLASIMDVAGNVPMIGDADDGYAVQLSQEESWCPYRSLLATGAILFDRAEFKSKAGKLDDKTRWIFGEQAEQDYTKINCSKAQLPVHQKFPDGGYYLLGCDFETSKEIRIVADAGPLGYEGIAAHGHADALAFTLSVGRREFLIDSGTYAYHTQNKWREYFRGTSAHNTLRVDEMDQSVSGGNFMWLQKANAWCEVWESDENHDRFVGVHDGYQRLDDPVTHRREINLIKAERKIVVTDSLTCNGTHLVQCYWHFSEACQLSQADDRISVSNAGQTITLKFIDNNAKCEIIRGDETRPLGWVSRRFDVKEPADTVVWKIEVRGDSTFTTEIYCS